MYGTLRAYVHGLVTTDSYDTAARRITSALEPLDVRMERQEVRFRGGSAGWRGPRPPRAALAAPGGGPNTPFLRETAEQSRYLMPEAEALAMDSP